MHDRAFCHTGRRSKRSRVASTVLKASFPRHHVVLGADANVSLNGFEDGRFAGDVTVPLTKARSCADAERAGALYEFMAEFWASCGQHVV